ncbi:DUF3488 and transglutaminase-like domain-containing protein [uncultured Amnibacterium sp.]|uniref:DUF3488 and transglutaminase-like domain-containing protein n=1 Tax=uncultured Amnibacterium sp. TaxID=1631851 RepID=UPI0035CA2DB3
MRDGRVGDGAVTAAVGAAVLIGMLAFLPVVQGALWWFDSLLLVAAALGTAAVGRAIGLPAAAGSLLGLTTVPIVAALIASAWSVTGSASPESSANAVIDAFTAAFRQIYLDSVPAQGTRELALLMGCGGAVVAVVADFVTVGLRAPIAGMLLVTAVAIVPGKAFGTGTNGLLLVAVAAGVLAVIAADRRRRGRAPRIGGLAAGGAAAVVVALLIQVVLPAPYASTAQAAGAPLIDAGANPLLQLGQDLRRGATTPVLSYTTRGSAPVYLRLAVLEDFSGETWAPNAADGDPVGDGVAPRAAGVGPTPDLRTASTTITPASSVAIGDRLPLPYPALAVQGQGIAGAFRWEDRGLTLARRGGGAIGTYSVTSMVPSATAADLRAASVDAPSGDADSLTLPSDVPSIIRRTADRWVRGAATPYDQALRIQNALANGSFSYDEQTPVQQGYDGDGLSVIAKFLQVKAGYCIHYASTMAVMARLEGIPARIVVGYQPGETQSGSAERRVSSDDLHAWPELYFDGIGWVRFEPTPGRGAVPAYAPLPSADVSSTPTAVPSTDASSSPQPTDAAQGGSGGGVDLGAILVAALRIGGTALAVLLVLAVPALLRVARRRRRLSRLDRDGPAGAWLELLDTATDLGLPSGRGGSPRAVEEVLAAHAGPSARTRDALARLRAAFERQAYSPDAARADAADVRRVVEDLRAQAGPTRRMIATVAPRSLVATIGAPRLAFRWSPPGSG